MNPSLWVSYFIIGPLAPLVDWPFHSHFSHAKNLRFPLPEKCPFSLVQRPFAFCQRFSRYLGFARCRLFHQLTTIYGTSNNGNSETFLFFTSPFLFFISSLPGRYRRTGPRSSGLGHPAHGGIKTVPQPVRACAVRRPSEVIFQNF